MGIERKDNIAPSNYFNRPLSRAKGIEVTKLPDCFGRSNPTPVEIEKAIHPHTAETEHSKINVIFYVDEKGVRPYREFDFTTTLRAREDLKESKNSRFKSGRRQRRSYRSSLNSRTSKA